MELKQMHCASVARKGGGGGRGSGRLLLLHRTEIAAVSADNCDRFLTCLSSESSRPWLPKVA